MVGTSVLALASGGAAGLACMTPGAIASGGAGPTPAAGNWEGTGSHGLPMSFALSSRQGKLVATAVALGAPLTCPANERDAEAVPLSQVSYAGPGAGGSSGSQATLSGKVPGQSHAIHVTGEFTSAGTGTFSIQVKGSVGCGWPSGTLTWRVRRARRQHIADRVWTAALSGPDITTGEVKVKVAAGGRVVQSFRSTFTCQTASTEGTNDFKASPAYEFIRPGGRFYSPLNGNSVKHHTVTWTGQFDRAGFLRGALRIYDSCTQRVMTISFRGA